MIVIKNKTHYTIVNAAKEFGVAPKTVHDWIEKGVIPRPPVVQYGLRSIQVFPPEYMKTAKRRKRDYQKRKSMKK
jgi:predicted site-specific integrase-resolvase